MLRTSKLSNNKVVTQTINIMTITEKHFYGYRFYLDGKLVAHSDTFYPCKERVRQSALTRVLDICQEIADELSGESYQPFYWEDKFDPNDPSSLDDEKAYNQCLANYNRVKHMIGTPCWSISEAATDSSIAIENGSPYEMTWTISRYKFKEGFEDEIEEDNKKFEVRSFYSGFCTHVVKAKNEKDALDKVAGLSLTEENYAEIKDSLVSWKEADQVEEIE